MHTPQFYIVYPKVYGGAGLTNEDYKLIADEYELPKYAHGRNVLKVNGTTHQDIRLVISDHADNPAHEP